MSSASSSTYTRSIERSPHRGNKLLRNQRRISRLGKYQCIPRKKLCTSSTKDAKESQVCADANNPPSSMFEDTTECSENVNIDVGMQVSEVTSPLSTTEREQLYHEMDNLRSERDMFKAKLIDLKASCINPLTFSSIQLYKEKSVLVTGLEFDVLQKLIDYLCQGMEGESTSREIMNNQIILTIVRLRQNYSFEMLAYLANTSKPTLINHFWKWLDIMHLKLKFLVRMQDRDHIFKTIPPNFKAKFPRLTSIIDCFEVFVESPTSLMARAQLYSQYKKHCTIKVFISCTPLGAINFVSKCWGGRASDIQIVRESGFHTSKFHMPNDQILADRGFTLIDDFAAGSGSQLIIPAFTKGKSQLSAKEVEDSRKIASVRIHIERVIGLLKNRYTILKGIIPLRTIKNIKDEANSATLANCDKIVQVCAALTNLGESIIYRD